MEDSFEKKSIEHVLSRIENVSDKKITPELINKCYEILEYYKKPINAYYGENASKFCGELKNHIVNFSHHFPNETIRHRWKNRIIEYLKYAKENIDEFKKII